MLPWAAAEARRKPPLDSKQVAQIFDRDPQAPSVDRLDEASRALLVPASRFEMLECQAAVEAVAENALDGDPIRTGALDVLAQHMGDVFPELRTKKEQVKAVLKLEE